MSQEDRITTVTVSCLIKTRLGNYWGTSNIYPYKNEGRGATFIQAIPFEVREFDENEDAIYPYPRTVTLYCDYLIESLESFQVKVEKKEEIPTPEEDDFDFPL